MDNLSVYNECGRQSLVLGLDIEILGGNRPLLGFRYNARWPLVSVWQIPHRRYWACLPPAVVPTDRLCCIFPFTAVPRFHRFHQYAGGAVYYFPGPYAFREIKDSINWANNSIMDMIPFIKGTAVSCMGTEANSAIIIATTIRRAEVRLSAFSHDSHYYDHK